MWWIILAVYLLYSINTYFIHITYDENDTTNQVTLMAMAMVWPVSVVLGIYKLYKEKI